MAPTDPDGHAVGRKSMTTSSAGLILGKLAQMGLGFFFWVLAARLASSDDVGLAAGVVSAIMLCTQMSVLGAGAAYILRYAHCERPSDLLDSATALVACAAIVVGGAALLTMYLVLDAFTNLASHLSFNVVFLSVVILGTITLIYDQVAMAMGRGDQVLVRNAVSGVIVIVALLAADAAGSNLVGAPLFYVWAVGGVTAFCYGLIQLRRTIGYRFRPRWRGSVVRDLLMLGSPNHLLTLAQRTPGLLLPVMVANLLSLTDNAHWYIIWMMAWAVYITPISAGVGLFAEAARRPETAAKATRKAIAWSLLLGGAGAGVLALLATPLLSFLGAGYSDAGAAPLRILLMAVIPMTIVEAYFATCRAKGLRLEPIATAVIMATVACILMPYVGTRQGSVSGLSGMALVWVAVQCGGGLWASLRLRRVAGKPTMRMPVQPRTSS
jgi:O-antigen/teichoic acid export membrane protein